MTIIFLDIANAFLDPVTEASEEHGLSWILHGVKLLLLRDRKTMLSFADFTLESINIDNGIGQGETGSMILYLIYSYGLVAIP